MIVARVDHRQGVLAKVDPVIEAHHKGVGISEVFVSIYPHVAFKHVNYIFPMIPALFPTSAGERRNRKKKHT